MTQTLATTITNIRVPVYPLTGLSLQGEFKIADHINLTGAPIKNIGFIPITDLYTAKHDPEAIVVVCLKHGVVPTDEEAKYLISQNVKAYTYDLVEPALFAAANGKQVNAIGYVPQLPKGFQAYGACAGLKETGRPDLGILVSDRPCVWAGSFTQNRARAFCVEKNVEIYNKKSLVRAVICNAGNANACTGVQGEQADLGVRAVLAQKFNCGADEVLMASTGKIGVLLPDSKINKALQELDTKQSQSIQGFAEAILTTDLTAKVAQDSRGLILGFTKGSGMIAPKMSLPKSATMLAFLVTDVKLAGYENDEQAMQNEMRKLLGDSADRSFNSISVDGDTSTNDMVMLLSNMQGKSVSVADFKASLDEVCMDLAEKIILDGEGTTKIIDLNIRGLADEDLARKIGMVIINSPLVKTAIHGCDPNWGRIIAALGNAAEEFDLKMDFSKVRLKLLGHDVFAKGMPLAFDRAELVGLMKRNKFIKLELDLPCQTGSKLVRVLGSDLSYDYIRINAEYFT